MKKATQNSATPRWEAIAEALREDILQGRFAPGTRLPNEQLLAERFEVNRHTLRQAVKALVAQGHLHVRQGAGTFVRELVLDYALKRRTRLTENIARAGERAERELIAFEHSTAGEWAAALKVPVKTKIESLYTRSSVRGRPVGLSHSVFPCPRFEGMGRAVQSKGSITEAFKSLGVSDYTRARSTVSARMPTVTEADALARPVTQPVLVVNYVNHDSAGRPIEAGSTIFAADAVQLTVEPEGLLL